MKNKKYYSLLRVTQEVRIFNQEVFLYRHKIYQKNVGKIQDKFFLYDLGLMDRADDEDAPDKLKRVFTIEDKALKAFDKIIEGREVKDYQEDEGSIWAETPVDEVIPVMLPEDKGNLGKSIAVLAEGVLYTSYKQAGEALGVSDNAIRKRIKNNWEGYTLYGKY